MTDTLTVLKNIRQVNQKLEQCSELILNKQKKAEMEKLRQELRLLEDSLLVKDPLNTVAFLHSQKPSFTPSVPSINSFRVFADQHKLLNPNEIQRYASEQFPKAMVPEAVKSVINMNQARNQAEIEAQAAFILADIRPSLYGRNFTPQELAVEVKRYISGQPTITTANVDAVSNIVTTHLLREFRISG